MVAAVLPEIVDPKWPIDVDTFEQMVQAGVFDEDDHVELLEGVVIRMPPHGPLHAGVLARLTEIFFDSVRPVYTVRSQSPVKVRPQSEPEPDLAIVPREDGLRLDAHPTTAILVVEVSNTSIAIDRGVKLRIYAMAGVAEYWIVDVLREEIEVRTEPDAARGEYAALRTVKRDEVLTSTVLPAVSFPMSKLFA